VLRRRPSTSYALGLALVIGILPLSTDDASPDPSESAGSAEVTMTDNVTPVAHFPFIGGSEVDFDGERYLFAGQANLTEDLRRQDVEEGQDGGLHVIDTQTMRRVGHLDCPGTDNYVRYLDPEVFNTEDGDREFVAMAHHGNVCTQELLEDDPNTRPGYGAYNGVMIVDVTNKRRPEVVSAVGHDSAHTVMPHPTEPYLYILPGGLANGTNVPNQSISPTAIVDVSDPHEPEYVTKFTHNVQGCHDLGFSHDGAYAFCAGLGEVQVWDIAGDRVTDPQVVGTIVNPAIQFAHNVVVSPSGRYIAINDEAFGFHSCSGEAADLYGSLWIYDISVPEVPVPAGRIAPPDHPDDQGFGTLDDVGPVSGWADSWCAAHNYNWVPGTDDYIVASWFAGGVTAHDMSDPMSPELVAHYMPHDGVAWSGHYYGGYVVTNDMARGVEILDVPELREAERAARDDDGHPGRGQGRERAERGPDNGDRPGEPPRGPDARASLAATAQDRLAQLLPDELPARPTPPRDADGGGFCALPGRPVA
jgi:hypothetical protein